MGCGSSKPNARAADPADVDVTVAEDPDPADADVNHMVAGGASFYTDTIARFAHGFDFTASVSAMSGVG